MLVIMHYRDGKLCPQGLFNIKALRGFNIFEIDASERWCQRFYYLYKFFRVFLIYFNIKNINVCKYFKEYVFAFHYRFTRLGPNITKAKHSSTIADYSNQVA